MGFISWLSRLFNKALSLFKEFIQLAIPLAKQVIIGQVKAYAIQVVSEINEENITNEEKREKTFERIKDYTKRTYLNASDSLIYLIIELSVSFLKEKIIDNID